MLYLPVTLIVMTLEPLNSHVKSSCIIMFNCSYAFSFKFLLYWLYAIRNLHMILFMMNIKKRVTYISNNISVLHNTATPTCFLTQSTMVHHKYSDRN